MLLSISPGVTHIFFHHADIYITTAWVLSSTLFDSAAAQDLQNPFVFDGTSFASPSGDYNGAASIFRFDDIKEGKNFTLNWDGIRPNITRLDLMAAEEAGQSLTLASWCPDENCTSTAGFSLKTVDYRTNNITLESEVTGQLVPQYVGAALYFRLDWQPEYNGQKQSAFSQEWSVAKNGEDVTSIFQIYQSTITAGAAPMSSTGPAPTTVSDALFSTAPPGGTTVSTTTAPQKPTAPTGTAAKETSGTEGSKAWIAGPVVGGIAVISLFALGVFLYRRRQRRRTPARPELEGDTFQGTGDKPQLHSDCLPPRCVYEMDASSAPCEADDGALPEMAANEAPARQLAADHHHLQPSEGGTDVVQPPAVTAGLHEKTDDAQDTVKVGP